MASQLETYFEEFRRNTIGRNATMRLSGVDRTLVYADWTATGRLYRPIEDIMLNRVSSLYGNTHSESSLVGQTMSVAYGAARQIVKRHLNASDGDCLISCGSGTTAAINKFLRLLHLPENAVILVTHMEHHSNHLPWLESGREVRVLRPDRSGLIDLSELHSVLHDCAGRQVIGAFTACSNVTGIETPYHEMARLLHQHGGLCFIDFAASAAYTSINMHPWDPDARLDAVYFSPHKFLGGPGSPGILVFSSHLYNNDVPDEPGGGTVLWTNPWGGRRYHADIELREDSGTPAIMQMLRAALAIRLKDLMTTGLMRARDREITPILMARLLAQKGIRVLMSNATERLPIVSAVYEGLHYNLAVKVLSDQFGIQARGGCSCAGTYGHYLLSVDREASSFITGRIDSGDLSIKPGWVRVSLHPTMTDAEVDYIGFAMTEVSRYVDLWNDQYVYCPHSNEFRKIQSNLEPSEQDRIDEWFRL